MKTARECFGTKEFSKKSIICKDCPYSFACKITLRRYKKSEI